MTCPACAPTPTSWCGCTGPPPNSLQAALRGFRRTGVDPAVRLAWSAMGTHRPAEFSRDHVPSFMLDTQPKDWLCVYPFVRSYEWYLLPDDERREMLRDHGLAGREFRGVQANTVAAFALGDWEWILALEVKRTPRARRPDAPSARRRRHGVTSASRSRSTPGTGWTRPGVVDVLR